MVRRPLPPAPLPSRLEEPEAVTPDAADEQTVLIPAPTLEDDRREVAALEATVEHVYDFEVA